MRTTTTTLLASLALAAWAAPALAADGTGGAAASTQPQPDGVGCAQRCADLSAAQPGSVVRIVGSDLGQVARVVFTAQRGGADDVWTRPSRVGDGEVQVVVPDQARSGPLVLVTGDGVRSEQTEPLDIAPASQIAAADTGTGGVDAKVETRRVFFDGRRAPALNYLVRGSTPTEVAIVLVQAATGNVVARWSPGAVEPGTVQRVRWNGIDATTKEAGDQGRYEFRVLRVSGTARSAQADPIARSSFYFYDHVFPIRGRHDYGSDGAQFGAGRSGHSHQGHDVFAKCGTPLVAARGGKVKFAGWHSRAGNYVVIDGQATGVDYVYMHMQDKPLHAEGDSVSTGDPIGSVGDTGVAHGCHLHFELWSAPGWYTGGSPFDPLAELKAWDKVS